jgi:futalosine hydrolase
LGKEIKKPLVLVTATAKEMRSFLPSSGDLDLPAEGNYCTWQYKQREYVLLVTGIGPINAALALGRLLGSGLELSGVLNVGIAGTYSTASYPLASKVLVGREIWPEFGLWTAQGLDCKALGWAMGKTEQGAVWDRIELEPQSNCPYLGLSVPTGTPETISLSVGGVTGFEERRQLLQGMYLADIENMEGFALAWACLRQNIPFVEVRSISNLVGSREKKDWDLNGALGALKDIFQWLGQVQSNQLT